LGVRAVENLLGAQMRQARRDSGLRFDEFARRARFSVTYLRNVEGGSRPATPAIADAYDRVLATGGRFRAAVADALAAAERTEAYPYRRRAPKAWDQPGNMSVLAELLDRSDVERRRFIAASGSILTDCAVRWSSALGRARLPEHPASTVRMRQADGRLIDHIDQRLDLLRHLDDELGSGEHAALARNELAFVVRLLKTGSHSERSEKRLYSLASEASRQTAWSHFDQGNHAAAQAYFEGAMRASVNADDATAGAYALSFLAVHCYSTGNAREAVSLLDSAQSALSGQTTPKMSAMLAARSARANSKAGERTASIRDLSAARVHLDRGPRQDDPSVLYWVTEAEIEMIAGSCALELGDPAEALRRFDAALAADYQGDDQYPRSAAIYLARAAEAHLALHELDAAVARATHAARCLGSVDSVRSSSTLAGLHAKLEAHVASPVVRAYLEGVA
jgi:tetratricopeptide (TPR) repeat protein